MIFLLGPTASGKSALAMAIAHAKVDSREVEIVSVDSAQVFTQMDIGTAKPSTEDLGKVTHHLINVVDPINVYSAAQFAIDAALAHQKIVKQHRVPLLVGGTMLYVSALTKGLSDLPSANAAFRTQLEKRAEIEGWPALHAELAQTDPLRASQINQNDSQRIQRALEIIALTGKTVTEQSSEMNAEIPGANTMSLNAKNQHLIISLEPGDRSILHERIERRLKDMYDAGLVNEVRNLMSRGDLHADMPSMRCVGYRQVWETIQQSPTATDAEITAQSFYKSLVATRQLAKRQLTWLRAEPNRITLDCLISTQQLLPIALEKIQQYVQHFPEQY